MADNRRNVFWILANDEKNPSLAHFSNEVIDYIGSFAEASTLSRLSRTCKGANSLFKSRLDKYFLANQLLKNLVDYNESAVKAFLKSHKNISQIITTQAHVKDKYDRKWKASPLEFVAWVGAFEIVDRLLKFVSNVHLPLALEQLKGVKENSSKLGKYLSVYRSLIEAYKAYETHSQDMDDDKRYKFWCDSIVAALRDLSVYGQDRFYDTRYCWKASESLTHAHSEPVVINTFCDETTKALDNQILQLERLIVENETPTYKNTPL